MQGDTGPTLGREANVGVLGVDWSRGAAGGFIRGFSQDICLKLKVTTAKGILCWVSQIILSNFLIRKPLDSCTDFLALDFSGDVGPKITVSFCVLVYVSFS